MATSTSHLQKTQAVWWCPLGSCAALLSHILIPNRPQLNELPLHRGPLSQREPEPKQFTYVIEWKVIVPEVLHCRQLLFFIYMFCLYEAIKRIILIHYNSGLTVLVWPILPVNNDNTTLPPVQLNCNCDYVFVGNVITG